MKNFRTVVTPAKAPYSISHKDKIVSIGSCFSENIGKKFTDYKFPVNVNPFGQQYNPQSIAYAINRLLEARAYTEEDLVYHDELYHSFDHHGSFSRSTVQQTLSIINENLQSASTDLKMATCLFLTFGTSHVFSLKSNNKVVSNCHKLSGNNFDKRLLVPAEIFSVLNEVLTKLVGVNPNLKIIFTVSPVRYFAFGHYENSVSKAHLFTAIYQLQQKCSSYFYFPAYELVMDDLRDYRFFSDDMLHPNYQATGYVWERLCETMMDKHTISVMREIEEVMLAVKHKPRNPHSEAHRKFLVKNLDKISNITKQYGFDMSVEEDILRNEISTLQGR